MELSESLWSISDNRIYSNYIDKHLSVLTTNKFFKISKWNSTLVNSGHDTTWIRKKNSFSNFSFSELFMQFQATYWS